MNESYIADYLRLRLLVGYLGERSQFGWWSTAFFDPASKLFLEPVFPKTVLLAQYHGITEAARRLHDEHVGMGRVYHLFRLPEELEQSLHMLLPEERGSEIGAHLTNRQLAMETLLEIAESAKKVSAGPVAVGRLGDISKTDASKKVAQMYLAAFEDNLRTFPYFAD